MKKKIFYKVVLFILMGNMMFAAGTETNQNTSLEQVKSSITKAKEKIEDNIDKAENTIKAKKGKIDKFISKLKGKSWKLVWDDEFNGDNLDSTKWAYWENGNPWNALNYFDENG